MDKLTKKTVIIVNDRSHGGGAETIFLRTLAVLKNSNAYYVYSITTDSLSSDFTINDNFHTKLDDSQKGIFKGIKYVFNSKNYFYTRKVLETIKPDIIHLHSFYGRISPSLLLAIKSYKSHNGRLKVIQTLHDYSLMCPNSSLYNYHLDMICEKCVGLKYKVHILKDRCYHGNFMYSFLKFLRTSTALNFLNHVALVDLFIAPSEFMVDMLKREGIDSSKIKFIPNPIEIKSGLTYETFSNKKNQILYVGRLSSEKGVDILIKSWKNLYLRFPDWKLIIVGDGSHKPVLMKLAEDTKNIEFTGWVSQEKVFDLMQNSKILVLPSVLYENQPSVVIEGIVNGVIPIVNAIGGMKELAGRYVSIKMFENTVDNLDVVLQEAILELVKVSPVELYKRYLQDLEKINSYHNIWKYGKELENVYESC